VHLSQGDLRKAYELAEQLLRRAQSARDPAGLMHGQVALGRSSFEMGELLRAREHFELAITLYDPERHRPLTFSYLGLDARVYCLSNAALTLLHLGLPRPGSQEEQ
jgi:hypothetical protein